MEVFETQRKRATFSKQQLSKVIYQTSQNLSNFLKIQKTIEQDPILKFNPSFIHSSRKTNMLQHAKKLIQHHTLYDFNYQMKSREGLFFSQQIPLFLHFSMFLITLSNLCSERQLQLFYKPALKGQIIGCYAQTQLSHGSDVQSLQTTATWDQTNRSFILNMPTTQSIKWWIGQLGFFANHAIIFAQLIIKNKKYGIHAFLVPIRDSNHNTFPGIEVGDVGPKYGYNCKDNGYLKLTNYEIPRRYMLMKFTKVSVNGQYQKRGNEKISYATMLISRSFIPWICHFVLSKACVIAVRYSLYRTQFKDKTGKQIPLLDYQLQQQKVLLRLSQCFAHFFGSCAVRDIANQVFNDAKLRGKFTRLNQAHCLTSGFKAIVTNDSTDGVEILRRAMGGHGYSMYSGLPGLVAELSPVPTYQGENTILFLQVARFLIKSLGFIAKGKDLPPTVQYLKQVYRQQPFYAEYSTLAEVLQPENIRKIMMYHSCQAIKRVALKLQTLIGNGEHPKTVWDTEAGLDLKQAAISHTYFWLFENFLTKIYISTTNQKVRQVLTRLLLLYGIEKILIRSNNYFSTKTLSSKTLQILQQAKQHLLKQVRPDALTIVQAFQYSDNTLHSALGGVKADPYQVLLKWVRQCNQVNQPQTIKQINSLWAQTKRKIKANL